MSCCNDFSLQDIIKRLIRNTASLETSDRVYMVLHVISLITLIGCLSGNQWLSGDAGRQGLWTFCYYNGTSNCCAGLDDVVGYRAFIGATRAFLIIGCVLYLGIFYTFYKAMYKERTEYAIATGFTVAIGISTFLAIVIYGARHKDVKETLNLHATYGFCVVNMFLQIGLVIGGFLSIV